MIKLPLPLLEKYNRLLIHSDFEPNQYENCKRSLCANIDGTKILIEKPLGGYYIVYSIFIQ